MTITAITVITKTLHLVLPVPLAHQAQLDLLDSLATLVLPVSLESLDELALLDHPEPLEFLDSLGQVEVLVLVEQLVLQDLLAAVVHLEYLVPLVLLV